MKASGDVPGFLVSGLLSAIVEVWDTVDNDRGFRRRVRVVAVSQKEKLGHTPHGDKMRGERSKRLTTSGSLDFVRRTIGHQGSLKRQWVNSLSLRDKFPGFPVSLHHGDELATIP